MFDPLDRRQFLNLAALAEGGCFVLALGLGWLADIDPLGTIRWTWTAVLWGVAATAPMLLLFEVIRRVPVRALQEIERLLVEMIGPSLAACTVPDLIMLAAAAGVCEEALFRGLLQPWIGGGSFWWGLILSNVIFGIAHLITPLYGVLAMLIGVYLGLLWHYTQPPNLLAPIVAHGLYDFVAFLMIAGMYRRLAAEKVAESEQEEEPAEADVVPEKPAGASTDEG